VPRESVGAVVPSVGRGFEVAFVDANGIERHEPLTGCLRAEFERARPVRGFASFPGQSHFPGLWWFSSAGTHVGFESWLERDVVMWLAELA
jgi:hypothetical protein